MTGRLWVCCIWESEPYCLAWWAEKLVFPSLVATAVAMFALWQIRKKRASDYASEQLSKFYAPMLGYLSELAAHREMDDFIKEVNREAHSSGLERDRERPLNQALLREFNAATERIKNFFEVGLPSRFTKQRVDRYLAMREHFTTNLAYADADTQLDHYNAVYEEVEKMRVYRDTEENDMFLAGGRDILASKVDMKRLKAFQDHLAAKVLALKREIKG